MKTTKTTGKVHRLAANREIFGLSPYQSPDTDNLSPLAVLLDAVGKFHDVGQEEGQPRFNTNTETLNSLKSRTEDTRKALTGGLGAIGDLLEIAGGNTGYPVPVQTLQGVGWLIKNLSDSLQTLEDLRQTLERGQPLLDRQDREAAP